MEQVIHAIYEDGKLRLLEPVALKEGQRIEITIKLSEDEQLIDALGDLLAHPNLPEGDEDLDEEALMTEIREGFKGLTVSDLIIQERREGM